MEEIRIQEDQIRQLFASVVWTHKIQEKQADLYRRRYKLLDALRIVLIALTSSGIFSVIFIDKFWLKLVSAILSAVTLFISIYCSTYDLKGEANDHKETAFLLFKLREKLISILVDIKSNKIDYWEIQKKKEEVYDEYFLICRDAKDASAKAVKLASKALKINKDSTYSDEEIDAFLPELLRKK